MIKLNFKIKAQRLRSTFTKCTLGRCLHDKDTIWKRRSYGVHRFRFVRGWVEAKQSFDLLFQTVYRAWMRA